MKFPKFKEMNGNPNVFSNIHGISISEYRLSFLKDNFGITEEQLKKMPEKEAKTWIYKAMWIVSSLWSRIFDSTPPLMVAEDEFGIKSFDEFMKLTPEEFLGKNGLYDKVNRRMKEIDF